MTAVQTSSDGTIADSSVFEFTVQTPSDAVAGNNTAAGSTVVESTVRTSSDAAVFDNTVPENIFEKKINCTTGKIYCNHRN